VERLDTDVSTVQLALHQRPEVLHCVRVDIAVRDIQSRGR
jgi:hypothetical protein